jgi:hypothetical protein
MGDQCPHSRTHPNRKPFYSNLNFAKYIRLLSSCQDLFRPPLQFSFQNNAIPLFSHSQRASIPAPEFPTGNSAVQVPFSKRALNGVHPTRNVKFLKNHRNSKKRLFFFNPLLT